jgi:hypothetical protein
MQVFLLILIKKIKQMDDKENLVCSTNFYYQSLLIRFDTQDFQKKRFHTQNHEKNYKAFSRKFKIRQMLTSAPEVLVKIVKIEIYY